VLCRIVYIPSLAKSLNIRNSIKSKGKFALMDYRVLQVIPKIYRSVVIYTFQSSSDIFVDLYCVNLHHLAMI
jgi:hypothetical protein